MIADIRIGSEYRDSIHRYSDAQLESLSGTGIAVEIPWEPGVAARVEKHPGTKFVIFVRNWREMAAAAESLAKDQKFDIVTMENGRMALFMKGDQKWRDIASRLGSVGARNLLLALIVKGIRRGRDVRPLLPIAEKVVIDGAQAKDADILIKAWNLK